MVFPENVRNIPREERLEWLNFIFEDGFDAYDRMMKFGSLPQRAAAFHVRMFVRHPSLRWAAEQFFVVYFKIVLRKGGSSENVCTPVSR